MAREELSYDEQVEFLKMVDIGTRVRVLYNSGLVLKSPKVFEGYVAGVELGPAKVVLTKRDPRSSLPVTSFGYRNVYCMNMTGYVFVPPDDVSGQLELVFDIPVQGEGHAD
ncbi:hypothetical protein JW898_01635 [Candidatus Woesearchaeota archaeon]|nr:hypothetical protein [Candidatus Woesearchaeota archaeon]